jgi:hypothetical protein
MGTDLGMRWVGPVIQATPIRPYGYSGTRAYLQAQDIAREGVPALVQALESAISLNDERADYEDKCAEVASLQEELRGSHEDYDKLDNEKDDLKAKLDKLADEDNRVKEAEESRKEAKDARIDADHWREMYGRIESERLKDAKIATDAKSKLRELQDAFRQIVGDDPSALLTATYWRTQAHANGVELIALRKRVAELEAPSARNRTTRQLQQDVAYWRKLAEERGMGR